MALNRELAHQLERSGSQAAFLFGQRRENDAGECIPHVSLFMVAVERSEVESVLAALQSVADRCAPIQARGARYGHNPQGALELYFARTPAWHQLQHAVIAATEPLRRGRLRATDPSGAV